MIRHWLGQAPADDFNAFIIQTKQALWLEERHNDALAKIMGAKK